MIDIVLISPPKKPLAESKACCLPCYGLMIIAAVLEKAGYSVAYLDAKALDMDLAECVDKAVGYQPRYVGITAMTEDVSVASGLAEGIKAKLDIPIIIGGVHVTALPNETMKKYPAFDLAVIGEGEVATVQLLDALDKSRDLREIKGIAFRYENRIVRTGTGEKVNKLDTLPMPAWHLLPDLKKHYRESYSSTNRFPSGLLITSRGCYGKCIFCDRSVSGHKIRSHSVDYVIEMIDILHNKYGIRDISIQDEVFVFDKKRAHEMCDRLIEKNWDLTWSCEARVNDVDSKDLELLKKMKRAGCWRIAYGIESGSQEILNFLRKNITIDQAEKAVKVTRQAGIMAYGFFILGHPTETKKSMEMTVDLMSKLDIDDFGMTYFIPYPGSYSYRIAHEYGRFNENWESWYISRPDIFVPYGVTTEELMHYRKRAYLKFFLRPRIICAWVKTIRSPFDLLRLFMGGLSFFKEITISAKFRFRNRGKQTS